MQFNHIELCQAAQFNEIKIWHAILYPLGDQYDGEWSEDMRCGTGVMKYSNGEWDVMLFSFC